jgi:hypothetical protein
MAGDNRQGVVQSIGLPERRVCVKCEEPWKSDQKKCACGGEASKWMPFNPATETNVSAAQSIVKM